MSASLNPFLILKRIAFRIKYPKLLLLTVSIFLGYLIFKDENNFHFHAVLDRLGYVGTFLAGMFFSHGFTTGPAVATLLLISEKQNFFVSGVIATVGSLFGNYFIFKTLKISFEKEVYDISSHPLYKWVIGILDRFTPMFVRSYVLPVFAGIISATPLPDEFSAALVHASKNMSYPIFATVSFIFNAFGIFIIMLIGRMI
ncbi:MAG: hypothetical protein U9O20_00520 [Patescibacteria group bacterium]|nr:hypothetical protein [Patescibacteria group bacterium]